MSGLLLSPSLVLPETTMPLRMRHATSVVLLRGCVGLERVAGDQFLPRSSTWIDCSILSHECGCHMLLDNCSDPL